MSTGVMLMLRLTVAFSLLLARSAGLAVLISMTGGMFTVLLEKLAGVTPLVLFAGGREHRGNGENGGGNLGLHVGTRRLTAFRRCAR